METIWPEFVALTLSGLILFTVTRLVGEMTKANKWRRSVDNRLARIEAKLGVSNPGD